MNRVALALMLTACAGLARSQEIRGAGSTAAAKLIQEWAAAYRAASKSVVAYEDGGSGAGLLRLKAGEVPFAVSDVALSMPELQSGGFAQFPVALGGIVPVVNVPGVAPGQLRLNGELLARLFGAKTAVWNAPEIAALNPGVTLPALQARIAHRSDSSGSTALFTGYLSRVSAEWKSAVGSAMTVKWPAGSQACEGSDAMADYVAKTPGAIGYVDFSRAQSRGLSAARLENRSKTFVAPSKAGFQSAAAAFRRAPRRETGLRGDARLIVAGRTRSMGAPVQGTRRKAAARGRLKSRGGVREQGVRSNLHRTRPSRNRRTTMAPLPLARQARRSGS